VTHFPQSRSPRIQVLTIGIVLFGLLCGLALIWPLARLPIHYPIDVNEAWNALNAERAMDLDALYPSAKGAFFNNYPPLSFYLVGLAGRLLGDNIIAGRVISLLSILAIGINISWTVRNLGGALRPAILAGLLFVGTTAKDFLGYTGMDDPQLLGQAVMSTGFAIFAAAPRRGRNVAVAAAIMVTAGFIKHNIFGMPLAVTIWLAQYDRRMLARWLGLGLALLALAFAICAGLYGLDFFRQLDGPRTYSLSGLLALGRIQAFVIPLVLWIAFAVEIRSDPRTVLVTDLVVAGAIAYAITKLGSGVAWNAFFDWLIGVCVGLGIMLSRIGETRFAKRFGIGLTEGLIVIALCLRLILPLPENLLNLHASLADMRRQAAELEPDIEFMRSHAGPALCEGLAICYWSGHQSALDWINTFESIRLGRPNYTDLKLRVAKGDLHLLQLNRHSSLVGAAQASGQYRRFDTPSSVFFYY
jgi:hypothetical protein